MRDDAAGAPAKGTDPVRRPFTMRNNPASATTTGRSRRYNDGRTNKNGMKGPVLEQKDECEVRIFNGLLSLSVARVSSSEFVGISAEINAQCCPVEESQCASSSVVLQSFFCISSFGALRVRKPSYLIYRPWSIQTVAARRRSGNETAGRDGVSRLRQAADRAGAILQLQTGAG